MRKFLIAFLLFAGFGVAAQTWTPVLGRWDYQWVKVDSGYRGPLDTLASAPVGSTAVKGSTLYVKLSTGYWQAITGVGGSGVWGSIAGTLSAQGDLMTKFGAKYDTTVRKMDTLYAITDSTYGFYINGVFHSFKARGAIPSFMGRSGPITLTQQDVDSALGYVPSQLPNVANSLQVINNGNTTSWQTGLYSARPSPGNFGSYYTATDSLAIYFDNGISWLSISKSAVSVPSVFGRTGPVVAITGDYTPAQVGLANVINSLQIVNTLGTPSASSDIFANRPAAVTSGRLFISTDTKEIYRDNGSSWDKVGSGASGGVTTYAALTDVNLTSLINGQIAQYNSGTGKWVNITPTSSLVGLGSVPNVDATNAANISAGTLPAARIGTASIDLTTKVTGLLPDVNIASAANWNAKVSDSGFQVLYAPLSGGIPIAKFVDGSGRRFILYDTTGNHPGGIATNAGAQKKIDSISAVIGALLSAKFGLTDTGYTKTLASVYTLRKVSDSLAAAYTAGLGTKFSLADTGYTKTLASINTLAKVRDSLGALILLRRLISDTAGTNSTATRGYVGKVRDSLAALIGGGGGGSTLTFGLGLQSGSYNGSTAKTLNLDTGAMATRNALDSVAGLTYNYYVQRSSPRGDSLLHAYQIYIRTNGQVDSLDFHHVINGDSSWTNYVQAHDTTSSNALQSKYRSDSARANTYAKFNNYLPLVGGTVTGPVTLQRSPVMSALTPGEEVVTDPVADTLVSQAKYLHPPVLVATTAALPANTYSNGTAGIGATLTGTSNGALAAQDGVTLSAGNRILVKNEAAQANDGIYSVTQVGSGSTPYILTRGAYSSLAPNMQAGSHVYVQSGTTNHNTVWYQQTTGTITFGTTSLVYSQAAGSGGTTVTTDTTLTGNGSGGSPVGMNPNLVANANYVPIKAYPPTNNTLFYGNSITFGYCPACGSGTEVNYPTIIQNDLGNTTINNGAISSTAVRTSYNYLVNNMPVGGAPTMGEAAFNDIRILMSGDTLHRFGHVHSAYRAMAALQFLNPTTIQFYFTGTGSVNSNITTSLTCGSCTASLIDTLKDFSSRTAYYRTNVTGQSGTNWWLKSSITANETVTIANVRGAGIVIGTWADSLGWSRIQVSVDGSVVTTYNPNNRITNLVLDPSFQRYGIQNDAIIIQGLVDTVHTVVLTFLDGSTMGGFDYVAGLKSPQSCYTTPMYVYDIMHMGAAGYSYSLAPTTQAVQDSCNNSRWNVDLLQFVNAGYPVYAAHENYPVGLYNPGGDPTQVQIDGIHPTGIGQRNIAVAGEVTMNIKQNYGIIAPAAATATLPVGPTGAVQSAGAAGFAGNSDFVHDSTNTGVTIGGGWLSGQAFNSSNAFWGSNVKIIGGTTFKYINTGFAGILHFTVAGGASFSFAPSGTAGASLTFANTPFWMNEAGQVMIGGNVSGTPSSYVDLAPATTSLASLYMAPGSQTTSGLKTGLFYSTSTGHYYFYNGSSWLQQDLQMGTATSGQMTFYNGTNSVTGSSHFLVDNTNFRLGVGASISTALVDLHVRNDQTGFTEIRSENQNSAGQAGFQGVNDGSQSGGIRIHGSTATALGPWVANMTALFSTGSAGVAIINNTASTPILFAQGSGTPTEQARFAPSGALLVGTTADHASSIFTLNSTTRGMLHPSMNTTSRNAISSPANGLTIFNSETNKLNWYDSVAAVWRVALDSARGATGGSNYQTVQAAGSGLTQRANLNILAPLSATDNSGNNSTDIGLGSITQLVTGGSTPSISLGAAVPTGGGTSFSFTSPSNSVKGTINIASGTGSGTGSIIATITLPVTQATAQFAVLLQAIGTQVAMPVNVFPISTTQFAIYLPSGTTFPASTSFSWYYWIVN